MQKADPIVSLQLQVYNAVQSLVEKLNWPDKSNKGKSLQELFVWKHIGDLASKKYDQLMADLVEDGVMDNYKLNSTPGSYIIGESKTISVGLQVTQPRREFNMDLFCRELERRYHIPPAVTKQLFDAAKQPGNSVSRRITIAEKSV